MKRDLSDDEKSVKKIQRELPNFKISYLYSDNQLMRNNKRTKYFLPTDSTDPPKNIKYFLHVNDAINNNNFTYILDNSSTLVGKQSLVDLRFDFKFISRQHCVIQYRKVRLDVEKEARVIPYLIDLNSKNGTYLNDEKIEKMKFVQLLNDDVVSFGKNNKVVLIVQEVLCDKMNDDSDYD